MPFIKKSDGSVSWVEPSKEDISSVRAQIMSNEPDNVVEMPENYNAQFASAIKSLVPAAAPMAVSEANKRLYDNVEMMLKEDSSPVDIIIPVYNSIHIVAECINSVIKHTIWPYRIIIVDDCSDDMTKRILRKFDEAYDFVTLIENKKNRGFAATVNRGIKEGEAPNICLLNSDVLVTPKWLTKMMLAMRHDDRNQIVNPVTNNTAMTLVPMPQGVSYLAMNEVLEKYSQCKYPEIMPTGFCFLFRRSLLDEVGLFDEGYKNFGEETDFWMKTITKIQNNKTTLIEDLEHKIPAGQVSIVRKFPRYRAVMADDAYVFHERGASFTNLGAEAHWDLRHNASSRFHKLWPEYRTWKKGFNVNNALGHIKRDISANIINELNTKYSICWVVHSTAFCGGMKFICDIVNKLIDDGVDARIALIKRNPDTPDDQIEILGQLRTSPVIFRTREDFVKHFPSRVFDSGIVVASTSELGTVVAETCNLNPNLHPMLHAQSYEPAMTMDKKVRRAAIESFKSIPNVISSSKWVTRSLREIGVRPFATVRPGVDIKLFYKRDRSKGDERPTLILPMLKGYPFKGYNRGVELIKEVWRLAEENNDDIRILVYGQDSVPEAPMATGIGHVSQQRLATVLGTECDLLVDPSTVHSYGLPALEAIASNVPVISWDNLGIREYLENGLVAPHNMPVKLFAKVVHGALTKRIPLKLKVPITAHTRDVQVHSITKAIEDHFGLNRPSRDIVIVTPHLRKHGGPTTIASTAKVLAEQGHKISLLTIYQDINPEVVRDIDLPIVVGNPDMKANEIPPCDVLITNSDNPCNALFASDLPQVKKKILLKLSHNKRFQKYENDSLCFNWNAIITSTEWLSQACQVPMTEEGWNHPSRKANRVGWFHYGHKQFHCPPSNRKFGTLDGKFPIRIGTLVHQHPLKGTKEAMHVMHEIFKRYGKKVMLVGIGEVPMDKWNRPGFLNYAYNPNRAQMAKMMSELDIWIGASFTEGLGRLALEAMSSGCACVLSNTGAEFAFHDKNCLLFKPGDVEACFNAVTSLIENVTIANHIRNNGYSTAELAASSGEYSSNLSKVIYEVCKDLKCEE